MTYADQYRDRLAALVQIDQNGCWRWQGTVHPKHGYANVTWGGINTGHRISYTIHRGPIPAGMELDHLCRVRDCVNPDHLEAVTHQENARRSPLITARKTHCSKGHAYDEANTHIRKNGSQYCRACARAYQAGRRAS